MKNNRNQVIKEINLLVPVVKNRALNEKMFGSLQGLNKVETTLKDGTKQVEI